MISDIISGLQEMGFVISKIKGEPYIIERLQYGKGIFGRNVQSHERESGRKKGSGMSESQNRKLKSTKGTYMREYKTSGNIFFGKMLSNSKKR